MRSPARRCTVDSPTVATSERIRTTSVQRAWSSATITVISFVMLAIGARVQAACCASTSPVAAFSTMNARAVTDGGDAACAALAKASAARTAAAQIRRITSAKVT